MRPSACAIAILTATLMVSACRSITPSVAHAVAARPAATGSTATEVEAASRDDNLNAVLWIQASAEYQATAQSVYRAATDKLDRALNDSRWDALVPSERDNAGRIADLPPAVIMDVDETALDNSAYQARLIRNDREYDEVSWDAWAAEQKAKPIPGAVDFANAAAARGIAVFYVSNRAVHLDTATVANLRAAGFPVQDGTRFLGLGTFVQGCEQNGTEKNCRRLLVGRKYRVLMQLGDQLVDFVQVLDSTPAGRERLFERYRDWFGERWWMLPNPSYGGWEPALFNNDWTRPRALRRAAKRAALDVAP